MKSILVATVALSVTTAAYAGGGFTGLPGFNFFSCNSPTAIGYDAKYDVKAELASCVTAFNSAKSLATSRGYAIVNEHACAITGNAANVANEEIAVGGGFSILK